jgi:hypothetical protein
MYGQSPGTFNARPPNNAANTAAPGRFASGDALLSHGDADVLIDESSTRRALAYDLRERRPPEDATLLRPGPRFLAFFVPVLPAAVMAFASTGMAQLVSTLIAVSWVVLVPAALYLRWAARMLPIASACFLVLAVATLPFNSAAFVINLWTTLAMFLLSFPRRRAT